MRAYDPNSSVATTIVVVPSGGPTGVYDFIPNATTIVLKRNVRASKRVSRAVPTGRHDETRRTAVFMTSATGTWSGEARGRFGRTRLPRGPSTVRRVSSDSGVPFHVSNGKRGLATNPSANERTGPRRITCSLSLARSLPPAPASTGLTVITIRLSTGFRNARRCSNENAKKKTTWRSSANEIPEN